MDRAIPVAGNEDIELYRRTYYSLLRSSGKVNVRTLEETHSGMNAGLHKKADHPDLDLAAFMYAALRLPEAINTVELVLLGQSAEVFTRGGYPNVFKWQVVKAKARRRKMFYNDKKKRKKLAVFINSISDIDDLVPMLVAFQIEWNKLHQRLKLAGLVRRETLTEADFETALGLSDADFARLKSVWGEKFVEKMTEALQHDMNLSIKSLAGSRNDYRRATEEWWRHAVRKSKVPKVHDRPVYFISSNMHAFPNIIGGYAREIQDELVKFLQDDNPENLLGHYQNLAGDQDPKSVQNLLYYTQRIFTGDDDKRRRAQKKFESDSGIQSIIKPWNLDVGMQFIELSKIDPARLDPRVVIDNPNWQKLQASDALIINVDYPLGMAAYQVLSQLSANVGELRGIYVIGKAATLNARVGDVMIPNVVYDEHSKNTYLFQNSFTVDDIAPWLQHGTVLDNQKAVTVRGTLLQNADFMNLFYEEGYTDIEMEAGPYLSAMYENTYPRRYPVNEIVKLYLDTPYDLGILHYASDKPYSRRQALLSESLLFFGMDSTYACAIATLKRILEHEMSRG